MKFKCYADGGEDRAKEYALTPGGDRACAEYVARLYVEEWHDDALHSTDVIVEPADGEAKALGGWHEDIDDGLYRIFVVTPRITYGAAEVSTFNRDRRVA